jgi:hypothetical protein
VVRNIEAVTLQSGVCQIFLASSKATESIWGLKEQQWIKASHSPNTATKRENLLDPIEIAWSVYSDTANLW